MVAIKQRLDNSISQPLIGEDYQCCAVSARLRMDLWLTLGLTSGTSTLSITKS